MDKENSELHDQVSALEVEKAQLLAWPTSSNAYEYPNIPQELYDKWIHAEAQLDVLSDLYMVGSIYETALEDSRVKARKAWLACDYDPATTLSGSEEDEEGGIDRLVDGAWYESAYPQGEDAEDSGGRGDGH